MIRWPAVAFKVIAVGPRLAVLLLLVTIYYVAAGLAVRWLRVPAFDAGEAGSLISTLILSLLMSQRHRVAYQRWWEARGLWGCLTNETRNLAAKCEAFVAADALARSQFGALLAAFPEALKSHLRGTGLPLRALSGFEHETGDPVHVPLHLARRLFGLIAGWRRDGHIDQGTLWILDGHAHRLLDVCGGCEKVRNTPLPPSYKGLLRLGLAMNVVAAPWLIVPDSGLWSLPVVLLACFFLFGIELIDSAVEEPFGTDRDDLDLERYCKTIREAVEACLPSAVESSRLDRRLAIPKSVEV